MIIIQKEFQTQLNLNNAIHHNLALHNTKHIA